VTDLEAAQAIAGNALVVTERDGDRWVATVCYRVPSGATRVLGQLFGKTPEAVRQALVDRFA
jgi:hypothetical protein